MSEAQPETVAGRALDGWIGGGLRWVDPLFPDRLGPVSVSIHDDILAIEAEARAAGAARYEAALRDVGDWLDEHEDDDSESRDGNYCRLSWFLTDPLGPFPDPRPLLAAAPLAVRPEPTRPTPPSSHTGPSTDTTQSTDALGTSPAQSERPPSARTSGISAGRPTAASLPPLAASDPGPSSSDTSLPIRVQGVTPSLPLPEPLPQGDGLDAGTPGSLLREAICEAVRVTFPGSGRHHGEAVANRTAAEYARLTPSRPAEERKPNREIADGDPSDGNYGGT